MTHLIQALQALFELLPLSLLEVWGRFGYLVGLMLMLAAFGGLTLRPAGGWGLGRERQAWDAKALLSMGLTFLLIPLAGYIGSSIVLVPGAQTFESLKDLVVLVCIVLFGYPALLAVAPAYMLSDLVEGVPPAFLLEWLPGYFINPACFWIAHQLIGHQPDFRRLRTWGWHLLGALLFLAIEPLLWGYICSGKFTSSIAYRTITPALFFTTAITWALAPFALLLALPLARRYGLFWAEIPGHVRQKPLRGRAWSWESGMAEGIQPSATPGPGLPIRMFLATPFVVLVLVMVGSVAYVTLRNGEIAARDLAMRLHRENSRTIEMTLDDHLYASQGKPDAAALAMVLRTMGMDDDGRVFVMDRDGRVITSSATGRDRTAVSDPVMQAAIQALQETGGSLASIRQPTSFVFDVVTARPLARVSWLAQATPYENAAAEADWVVINALPESSFLGAVRTGHSQAAMVFAVALFLSMLLAAALAYMVAAPIRRISRSAQVLAAGDLAERVPSSRLDELGVLSHSFNEMAGRLQQSVAALEAKLVEQERMQEELRLISERLQLATRSARIGIWEWSVLSNELIWDDAMYALYGVRKEEFGGAFDAWHQSLHPDDRDHAVGEIKAALDNVREFAPEFRIIWPDGQIRYIKAASQTIRDAQGTPLRMIGINLDVTKDKLYEEELRRHRDHLEDLVKERTGALAAAVDQAEAANRAKSAFLANMSHELRTPLNAVIGFSRLLAQADNLLPGQRQDLDIIKRSGSHLLTLINDVLDLSKIEAGKVQLSEEDVDLGTLIADVADMLRPRAVQAGLGLDIETWGLPACARVDGAKLRQVLINLLGNAIKFTREGGVVLGLSARAASDGRLQLDFFVRDSGIGIAPADQQRIFEPFVQMVTHATSAGTGLGLTLSRQYLQLLGGQLSVQSEPGRGSTFRFSLCLQRGDVSRARAPQPAEALALPASERGRRVLIVDDTPESLLLTRRLLEPLGFVVAEAHNGLEALAEAKRFDPELIVMDYRMPELDGVQATARLREDGNHVPIVILTASAFEEERAAALATGADEFLSKPLEEGRFHAMLERRLGLHFLREGESGPAPEPATASAPPEILSTLPAAVKASLREAARELNGGRVRDILLASDISTEQGAGREVLRMVEGFEYRELWELLDENH